jgi:hypothetical protein
MIIMLAVVFVSVYVFFVHFVPLCCSVALIHVPRPLITCF